MPLTSTLYLHSAAVPLQLYTCGCISPTYLHVWWLAHDHERLQLVLVVWSGRLIIALQSRCM